MTPSGIKSETFWLVAQCLNQLRHGVPHNDYIIALKSTEITRQIWGSESICSMQRFIQSQQYRKGWGKTQNGYLQTPHYTADVCHSLVSPKSLVPRRNCGHSDHLSLLSTCLCTPNGYLQTPHYTADVCHSLVSPKSLVPRRNCGHSDHLSLLSTCLCTPNGYLQTPHYTADVCHSLVSPKSLVPRRNCGHSDHLSLLSTCLCTLNTDSLSIV